jgi:hypothetical protein
MSAVRERIPTLDLEEGDIVGVAVAPMKSSAPPPPPVRSTIPAPPASHVALLRPRPTSKREEVEVDIEPVREADGRHVEFEDVVPRSMSHPMTVSARASTFPPPGAIPAPLSVIPAAPPLPAIASVPPPAPASVEPTNVVPIAKAASVSKMRLTMSDPTDLIFDGMYGLSFARSPGEAAEMCAETLARALGARAVVIHTHDLLSGELRAIGAHGDGDFDIIGSASPSDDDLVASAVICNQKSVTMRFDGELPKIAPTRLHAVGAPHTVVATPAMAWGRCLGVIEVIDADERYAARVADSAAYVADHFAQFLSQHAA